MGERRARGEPTVGGRNGRTVALAAVAWVSVLAVMGGAVTGIGAILHAGGTDSIDHSVWRWVVDHRVAALDGLAKGLTFAASTSVVVPLTIVVAALLAWWARRGRDAALVGASAAGAYLITAILKDLVERPRPPVGQRLVTVHEWSFPSGHATQSVALYGAVLVVVVASSGRGARVAGWCAGVLVALAVGWTRVYLGVHWFSDVLGGWAIGASWLWSLAWLLGYTAPSRGSEEAGEPVVEGWPGGPPAPPGDPTSQLT